VDFNIKHLVATLTRAAKHRGTSFVEVYQNCNVFNDGVWDYMKDRDVKLENSVELQDGKPLIFGTDSDKGIRLNGLAPEITTADDPGLWVHDEKFADPTPAFLLSRMRVPEFPEPIGVFRAVERPTYDAALNEQVQTAIAEKGRGDLNALLRSGDIWTVD
jgi:2-oxoglutarate ferredoxin oxidoreductase subunit beta